MKKSEQLIHFNNNTEKKKKSRAEKEEENRAEKKWKNQKKSRGRRRIRRNNLTGTEQLSRWNLRVDMRKKCEALASCASGWGVRLKGLNCASCAPRLRVLKPFQCTSLRLLEHWVRINLVPTTILTTGIREHTRNCLESCSHGLGPRWRYGSYHSGWHGSIP